MDTWETLAEIVRLQRRQAAHLDKMSEQLDKLERMLGDEEDLKEMLWEGTTFTVPDDAEPLPARVKGGVA